MKETRNRLETLWQQFYKERVTMLPHVISGISFLDPPFHDMDSRELTELLENTAKQFGRRLELEKLLIKKFLNMTHYQVLSKCIFYQLLSKWRHCLKMALKNAESDFLKEMKAHVKLRFKLLYILIRHFETTKQSFTIQIDRKMGKELAVGFWHYLGRKHEHGPFAAYLTHKMLKLRDRSNSVTLTLGGTKEHFVDFKTANLTSIRVWGANNGNHDLEQGLQIRGLGQALGIQEANPENNNVPGLFSIVTAPSSTVVPEPSVPWWFPKKLQNKIHRTRSSLAPRI